VEENEKAEKVEKAEKAENKNHNKFVTLKMRKINIYNNIIDYANNE
jgi:hypothetical protein